MGRQTDAGRYRLGSIHGLGKGASGTGAQTRGAGTGIVNANGQPKLVEVPSLDALASDPSQIDGLPLDVLKALWVDVRNLEKVLTMRLLMAPTTASTPEDRLIKIDEAAAILGMSKDRLYRTDYPFTVRDGGLLLFSNNGIQRWIRVRLRQG